MTVHPNEPLSWLTLERYALGELSAAERALVEQRLASSAQDRQCLDVIRSDQTVMPPLPVVPLRAKKKSARLPVWGSLLAAAAALLLMVLRPDQTDEPGEITPSRATKGGDVSIVLASERQGAGARTFATGERFKVLVTCPLTFATPLRVLVFQDGQRFEPLPQARLTCGNLVPWPGAFELDGAGDVEVCATWSAAAPSARSVRELGPDAACVRLKPAAEPGRPAP